MNDPKVLSLTVKPVEVAHLCFEVGGILAKSMAKLGASVLAFDFGSFYDLLSPVPTVPGDDSRVRYSVSEIDSAVAAYTLAALRAESRRTALGKGINSRQNAYFAKYQNIPEIVAVMNEFYSNTAIGSKPARLSQLATLSQQQADALSKAYISDGRAGVIKTTTSQLNATISGTSDALASGFMNEAEIGSVGDGTVTLHSLPPKGGSLSGQQLRGGDAESLNEREGTSSEETSTASEATEAESIVNTDFAYRTPYYECLAQNHRAQISLMDEKFNQFTFGLNLPNLTQVFTNELQSIDGDIYQLQIAYLNTILMSPIAGTVTGIYKNPGDVVRAGESVIRVENSDTVYLVGTVVYRGRLKIGQQVGVKTALFDSTAGSLKGTIVSVRGFADDEQWEVVINVPNLDHSGNPILPLGYHFDYDDTSLVLI